MSKPKVKLPVLQCGTCRWFMVDRKPSPQNGCLYGRCVRLPPMPYAIGKLAVTTAPCGYSQPVVYVDHHACGEYQQNGVINR